MTVQLELEEQLHEATELGDIDAIRTLFSDNPTLNVNATDVLGQSTLQIACKNGYPAIVRYLIDSGANLSHFDKDGQNAAHTTCQSYDRHACLKIIQILFDKDPAIVNIPTADGFKETCLYIAATRCDSNLIRWLLDAGADPSVRNSVGCSAWQCSAVEVSSPSYRSTPGDRERWLDACIVFLQKEVIDGQTGGTLQDISMRPVGNLEVYRLWAANTIDIFILLEHLLKRNVLQQSCQQIRRELCRFVETSNMQRYREPYCVFETHSDQRLTDPSSNSTGPDIPIVYRFLDDVPPWQPAPAPAPTSPPSAVDPSLTPLSQSQQKTGPSTSVGPPGPNYLSIVMPLLSIESKQLSEEYRSTVDTRLRKRAEEFKYCVGDSQDLSDYVDAVTLDEYCYPELPDYALERRNNDQTLSRGGINIARRVAMVNQVWIWQAQDVLIFAPLGKLKAAITARTGVLTTTYGHVGVFLADELDCDDSEEILQSFQISIVELAEKVSVYLDRTGIESIGIETEKEFYHEIHDIREELSMISRIFTQQEEVWREFASNAWPEIWADCLNGRTYWTTDPQNTAQKEDHRTLMRLIMRPRQRIQKCQRRVAQLDEDAERVERSVAIQLDLKQKHASLQEAHSTAVMSAAVFGFAVITIIFTPLSFVVGLFALPIDRLQDSQIPSRWGSDAGMYSSNYIGTWAATTEIVSVALTIAATWLALEYGLKYPVTRKMTYMLSTIFERLRLTLAKSWTAVKNLRPGSHSKAKDRKSAASITTTERRYSSLRDQEEV